MAGTVLPAAYVDGFGLSGRSHGCYWQVALARAKTPLTRKEKDALIFFRQLAAIQGSEPRRPTMALFFGGGSDHAGAP